MARSPGVPFRLALPAALLAATIALPAPGFAATADYSRTPVLMVHGWFVWSAAGDTTWAFYKDRLIKDGWPEEYLYNPSFDDVQGCDPDHANQIATWVDELLAKTGKDKVDILAHSEGGLNTMYYLKNLCGVQKVRHLVALAPAYHGTNVACVAALWSCGGKEMCITGTKPGDWKDNEQLVALNACDETPGDVLYTTIWSEFDEIIVPASGSVLAGARNIELATDWVEHGAIFLTDESYGYVKEGLLNGGLNEDGPGWDCIPQCRPEETPDEAEEADAVAEEADASPELAGSEEVHGPADVTDAAAEAGKADAGSADTGRPDGAAEPDPAPGEDADVAADAAAVPDVPRTVPPTVGGCTAGAGGAPGAAWLAATTLLAALGRAVRRSRGSRPSGS